MKSNAARTLLRQGRPDSAFRLIDKELSAKRDSLGRDSREYMAETIKNVEMLFDTAMGMLDDGRPDSAIPVLKRILDDTAQKSPNFPVTDETRMRYRALASFLNGCVEKARKEYEPAMNFFLGAATHFESCQMVTELALSHVGACHALLELERCQEALAYAKNAEDLLSSPEISREVANPVYEVLAYVHMKLGQADDAQEALHKAILCRHLNAALPRQPEKKVEERSEKNTSRRSTDSCPTPPMGQRSGAPIRAHFIRNRTRPAASPNGIPAKELGQLRLSISKLMAHC